MKKRTPIYLLDAAKKIAETSAIEADTVGYVSKFMVMASLPNRDLQKNEFVRKNGRYKLTILAPSSVGLPFGVIPRRLLIELVTQAKILKERNVYIEDSAAAFLRRLGKKNSAGPTGSLTEFRMQAERLFSSTLSITTEEPETWSIKNVSFAKEAKIVWQPISERCWNSTITLDRDFFDEIQTSAIPIDLRVIDACSHYALAIDIYCWLTYRFYGLSAPTVISWKQLQGQFGSEISRESNFRQKFRKALNRVSLFYSEAQYSISRSGLRLYPSPTHVPKTKAPTSFDSS